MSDWHTTQVHATDGAASAPDAFPTPTFVRKAIEARRRPVFDKPDEALVYDLFTELLDTRQVSDETYARAIDLFGESKLVELIAIFGHYNHVATVLNTFRVPVPPGWAEPLKD